MCSTSVYARFTSICDDRCGSAISNSPVVRFVFNIIGLKTNLNYIRGFSLKNLKMAGFTVDKNDDGLSPSIPSIMNICAKSFKADAVFWRKENR